jgi:DnaJ-class molecular chaperone
MSAADESETEQNLAELRLILAQPYKDVCNNCRGTGSVKDAHMSRDCPKCRGTGQRLLRLL